MRPGSATRDVIVGRVGRVLALALLSVPLLAQGGAPRNSLKGIAVPRPPGLDRYVRDERALIVLGKALFWDMQLSSDSRVACASCHFHAGADHRRQNQLSSTKDPVAPNRELGERDFPLGFGFVEAGHRVGSAGVYPQQFLSVSHGGVPDAGADIEGGQTPGLQGGATARQVTRRNAPSVINAVFSFRSFWDGRASNIFTGWTPFGEADTRANLLADIGGTLTAETVRIENASLASQAVGPPLDAGEMSYRGRSWPMLGRKMLNAQPLALQRVAPDDSVLGAYANRTGLGLAPEQTYVTLIHAAFREEYWRHTARVDERGAPLRRDRPAADDPGFTQGEYNFAVFFGLAIQAYESTLVSDDSPYDRYLDGQQDALTPLEKIGLEMFQRRACASCHADPELTLATFSGVLGNAGFPPLGPDSGFFPTGVEPVANDVGIAGRDPFGQPLSATARKDPSLATAFAGFFKTPSLRNVEFTGPYFHTGSKSSLEQIVDFYTFGGDYGSPNLRRWGPDATERIAMPAFMKTFTDDRVRFERAPFDHPELCVAVGCVESGEAGRGVPTASRLPADRWAAIPAVGAAGNRVPLQTFEELLSGIGTDGSRAHAMTDGCRLP